MRFEGRKVHLRWWASPLGALFGSLPLPLHWRAALVGWVFDRAFIFIEPAREA